MNASARPFVVAVDPAEPPPALAGGVFAIGNFDGVHRGHCAVLARARSLAERLEVPCAALTFEPHPADFFAGRPVVFRLTPFAEKAKALAATGIDGVISMTFDATLAALSAQDFVAEALVRRLRVGGVVVGADFHFGRARSGSPTFLRAAGEQFGFVVEVADKIAIDGAAVSSSAIRAALERGDMKAAADGLGRPFGVVGTVISGQRLGRTLGVPTANIVLAPTTRLSYGVYAVRVRCRGRAYKGVASFGVRPSVDNGAPLLETYIFDFDEDIYGESIEVDLIEFLRPELKFGSLDELKAAMLADIANARAVLV